MDSPPPSEVLSAVKRQTEYYFSDGNLAADQFLRNLILRDKDGYVPIKTIANFHRMKNLTTDMTVITSALKLSPELEVSTDETRVRRKAPMPEFNNQTSHRRTLVVENISENANNDWLRTVFGKYGKVIRVRIYLPGSADIWPRWLKNSNFSHDTAGSFGLVEFGTEEESSAARDAVQSAAPGSEEAGLRASWVQVKKGGTQHQGSNQQNRPQPTEKRPKQRANGNNDFSVQQAGGDPGNGASTSTPIMPTPQDMDHPPGFQPNAQPGARAQGVNAYPKANNRAGNSNQGGMSGNLPGGSNVHTHRPSRDPAASSSAPLPSAPPGTFIIPPPGVFATPGPMAYPQPMMNSGGPAPAAFQQPYPHPAVGARVAMVPLPAMMPLTSGSGTSGTPRQLSQQPKSTPRGVNNSNANGQQRPHSTGRSPPLDQDGNQAEQQPEGSRQQQQQQQQQQHRGQQQAGQEQQQQHRKGNSRVLVVPGSSERQNLGGPHPQPHPHLAHLQANQAQSSPHRPQSNANHANGPGQQQQRRRGANANMGNGPNADPGGSGRNEQAADGLHAGEENAAGAAVTPEPTQKHKKQKHKKGKGKGGSDGDDVEDGALGSATPASGGKGSHQKRGNQHKHDKQHHHTEDGVAEGVEDEEGKEWDKRRPRKDYASWAAATQDFRAQAVAKAGIVKGGLGTTTLPTIGEGIHKEGSQRGPRMPDGTKGFALGRGKPLHKQGEGQAAGAFVPSGEGFVPPLGGAGAPPHAGPVAGQAGAGKGTAATAAAGPAIPTAAVGADASAAVATATADNATAAEAAAAAAQDQPETSPAEELLMSVAGPGESQETEEQAEKPTDAITDLSHTKRITAAATDSTGLEAASTSPEPSPTPVAESAPAAGASSDSLQQQQLAHSQAVAAAGQAAEVDASKSSQRSEPASVLSTEKAEGSIVAETAVEAAEGAVSAESASAGGEQAGSAGGITEAPSEGSSRTVAEGDNPAAAAEGVAGSPATVEAPATSEVAA